VGLIQSVSIIPGVSRSAASIIGGMLLGMDRKTAVEFSFLLAIPTLLAATGLDLIKTNFSFSTQEWIYLATGFLSSFIVAIIVIKWLVSYVKKYTFIPFGIYRIIIAIFLFGLFFVN
jgi:undecaprenyl-diphosphatase